MISMKRKSTMKDINYKNVAIGAWIVEVAVTVIISLLLSYPLMLLWNIALVPAVSILSPVGWMQMWGIAILLSQGCRVFSVSTK
jgi:hypothetical protein